MASNKQRVGADSFQQAEAAGLTLQAEITNSLIEDAVYAVLDQVVYAGAESKSLSRQLEAYL